MSGLATHLERMLLDESPLQLAGMPLPTPFPNVWTRLVFALSLTTFLATYYVLVWWFELGERAPREMDLSSGKSGAATQGTEEQAKQTLKMRSWICTSLSSFAMTVVSLPYVYSLLASRLDIARLAPRPILSQGLVAFFMAYLVADCALGWRHYQSSFNVLTGWVHHGAYLVLLTLILNVGRCSHVFALAAIMELPTFLLSLGMIHPSLRHDLLFSVLFFVTRIAYHAGIIVLYTTPYGRLHGALKYDALGGAVGSWVPMVGLWAASPLHVIWFTNSCRGQIKRARKAHAEQLRLAIERKVRDQEVARPVPDSGAEDHKTYLLFNRPRLVSYLPRPPHIALRPRAHSFETEVRDYFSNNARLARVWRANLVAEVEELRVQLPVGLIAMLSSVKVDERGEVEGDVVKILNSRGLEGRQESIRRLRERAEEEVEELRRFGGMLRRRVGQAVMAL